MLTVDQGVVLGDRYVVGQQLGRGGTGTVWRAHDQVLDRDVAIKVVADGDAERLGREARAAAGIGTSNVVAVYDVGRQDGAHFLVMELVDGIDLATLLAATGALDDELVTLIGKEVASGVAGIHAAGLVHRDVSPANVLVTTEGQVKLTDLGIAQRTDDHATRRLTEVGTVVGTVDYLSPEQVEGREVTPATDVYAIGLLLHAASTGEAPFGDGPVPERLARRLTIDLDTLGSGSLGDVVAHATRRDPSQRYATGSELRDALLPLVAADERPLRRTLAGRVAAADTDAGASGGERTDTAATSVVGAGTSQPAPTSVVPTSQAPEGTSTSVQPTPGHGADESDDDEPGSVLWPILAAIVALVVVVGSVTLLQGDGDEASNAASPTATPTPTPTATTLTIAAVDDHDPLGGGEEHGEEVGRTIDGDQATAWDTEEYNSAELGGLKSGVGLVLDLGDVASVAAVQLDLGIAGVDVTAAVSDERPQGDPTDSATVLGTAEDAGESTTIRGETVEGRWVSIWFTELAPRGERFQAEVVEVRVLGPEAG